MGGLAMGLARRGAALTIALALLPGVAMAPRTALAAGAAPSTTTLGAPTLDPMPVVHTADITATVTAGGIGDVIFSVDAVAAARYRRVHHPEVVRVRSGPAAIAAGGPR